MENFRAIFYAPYYATHALGFYEREGVEVELLTSDAPGDAVPKLIDGSDRHHLGRADAGDEGARPGPALAAGVASARWCRTIRSSCSAQAPAQPFRLDRSAGQAVRIGVRGADALDVPAAGPARAGIDPDELARISDRAMTRNYAALKAGEIDVMQAFEPFVSMAEKDRAGDVLYAASTRGPTVYTAFIATRDACTKHRDEFAAMTRATAKMLAVALCQSGRGAGEGGPRHSFPMCRRTFW